MDWLVYRVTGHESGETFEKGEGEFEGKAVDDVGGPVFEVAGGGGLGRGRCKVKSGDGDPVCPEKEKGAEGSAGAGRDLRSEMCGSGVENTYGGAENVVDGSSGCCFAFTGQALAEGGGEFAGDDFGGVLLLGGFGGLVGLLLFDLIERFPLGGSFELFDCLLGGGGEFEEAIHDEGSGDAGDCSGEDGAEDGGFFHEERPKCAFEVGVRVRWMEAFLCTSRRAWGALMRTTGVAWDAGERGDCDMEKYVFEGMQSAGVNSACEDKEDF